MDVHNDQLAVNISMVRADLPIMLLTGIIDRIDQDFLRDHKV